MGRSKVLEEIPDIDFGMKFNYGELKSLLRRVGFTDTMPSAVEQQPTNTGEIIEPAKAEPPTPQPAETPIQETSRGTLTLTRKQALIAVSWMAIGATVGLAFVPLFPSALIDGVSQLQDWVTEIKDYYAGL